MPALDWGQVMDRRTLQAAAVAGKALPPGVVIASAAAVASPTTDPLQRFVRLVPGGNGIIYGIQTDGTLMWYRHSSWQTGGSGWANGGAGRQIDTDWQQFRAVLTSADGQLFGFLPDGTVRWYKYNVTDLTTGAGTWAGNGTGPVIGSGFDRFPRVLGGWQGVIYGVDDNGDMWWYHYVAGDGTRGAGAWANGGAGSMIGSGWKEIKRLWADPGGVIFGVRHAGELRWWHYLATNGSISWANGGNEIPIGEGWGEDSQKTAFSNGSGVIYSVGLDPDVVQGSDDKLYWYHLTNSTSITPPAPGHTAGTWANNGNGVQVGSGFTVEQSAALQGYASTLSVQPGGTVDIAVSTTFPSYTATVVQLAPAAGDPVVLSGPDTHPGRLQRLSTGYRLNGCGWASDFTIAIPANWDSGIYAARLEAPSGLRYYVVFVVNPAAPSAPIAFLLPTNTYNAYNYWAGHNQYAYQGATQTQGGKQRIYTFLRPSTSTEVDPPATISHTLYSDLFLLRWMSANGIAFDCYHDGDLHGSGGWLTNYKALVLASHPEYWSDPMRQNLVTYLSNGGRLICTGGNGIYERVSFGTDGNALIFRRPATGARDTFGSESPARPESQIIGANFDGAQPPFMTFAAYQVDKANHPLFAGTGMSNGSTFGGVAYNGGGSGWEVNTPVDPAEVGTYVQIAHGLNESAGAVMVYAEHSGGGWVFSANSISCNGSLPYDNAMSTIFKNLFKQAVS